MMTQTIRMYEKADMSWLNGEEAILDRQRPGITRLVFPVEELDVSVLTGMLGKMNGSQLRLKWHRIGLNIEADTALVTRADASRLDDVWWVDIILTQHSPLAKAVIYGSCVNGEGGKVAATLDGKGEPDA